MPALTKAQTAQLEAARSEVSNLAERDAKVKGRDLFERIEKQTKVRGSSGDQLGLQLRNRLGRS